MAQSNGAADAVETTLLLLELASDIDELSQPLVKAIEWEYQTVLEAQRIEDYALLLEPSEHNYPQARQRYLKKKKQKGAMLDKIIYVDRFYEHQLPNEIVPNTLYELRQIFELAPTIEKTMPRQLIQLLQPYRFHLETYQALGIRVDEVNRALEHIDRLEKKWYEYQQTETYQTHLAAERTIAAPQLHDLQLEEALRTQLKTAAGGTIHLVHVLDKWTILEGTGQWANHGQATMTSSNNQCYLVSFDVQKTAKNAAMTVKPYKYDPMPCEKVTHFAQPLSVE